MLSKAVLLVASAALAASSPITASAHAGGNTGAWTSPSCNWPHPEPVLPKNGGAEELPNPPADLKLKYIALGIGIQNYTCPEIGGDAGATGALAMLYDITSLYPHQSRKSLSMEKWENIPHEALWNHEVPLNFDPSTEGRVDPSSPGASQTNPFTEDAPLHLNDLPPLPFLGHHFFDSNSIPTFVLENGNTKLASKKDNGISPPANADKGPQGTGAVGWLKLSAKEGAGSVGAKLVYRVLTSGGNSHGCSKAKGEDSATYSATYWFYD